MTKDDRPKCEAMVYEKRWGFQLWRCEKPAKGRKADLDGQEYDACGVHLRAERPRFRRRGRTDDQG